MQKWIVNSLIEYHEKVQQFLTAILLPQYTELQVNSFQGKV